MGLLCDDIDREQEERAADEAAKITIFPGQADQLRRDLLRMRQTQKHCDGLLGTLRNYATDASDLAHSLGELAEGLRRRLDDIEANLVQWEELVVSPDSCRRCNAPNAGPPTPGCMCAEPVGDPF